MKILVTGATGFIGEYVINKLLQEDIQVIATSSSIEKAIHKSWFNKVKYKEYKLEKNNITNLYNYFDRPDKMIHLAWQGLPNYTELFHFESNLLEQYFFLKNLIVNGLEDVLVSGTCFEYGMKEGCMKESMESSPDNSYAIAKNSLRIFLNELSKKYDFKLKWVRLFYMYGKGQSQTSLIPQLEKAIKNGEKFFNMSEGDQLRDYMDVIEVADNLIKISLQQKYHGVINCCSGSPITIKNLVENYIKSVGSKIELNLGFYNYSKLEPFAFWGDPTLVNRIKGVEI